MTAAKEIGVKFVLCPTDSDFNDLFLEQYNKDEGYKAVRLSLRKSECGCIYENIMKKEESLRYTNVRRHMMDFLQHTFEPILR